MHSRRALRLKSFRDRGLGARLCENLVSNVLSLIFIMVVIYFLRRLFRESAVPLLLVSSMSFISLLRVALSLALARWVVVGHRLCVAICIRWAFQIFGLGMQRK